MLTSRRLRRSGPAAEDGLRTASRSRTGRAGVGGRSSTIVRTGGTMPSPTAGGIGCVWLAGGSLGCATPRSDSLASGCSRPSVAKLQGSSSISSGLIDHNLHRLDFGHQNTEVSGLSVKMRGISVTAERPS